MILKRIENNVRLSLPEIIDPQKTDYVFTFVMHGSLNVLRVWIQNGFETPTHEMAELIYTLCNNIAR